MRYILAILLLTVGCGGSGGDMAFGNLRPDGSPDIVIISISGHSGFSVVTCDSSDNFSYLANPGEAVDALVDLFLDLDPTIGGRTRNYADLWQGVDGNNDGEVDDPTKRGFTELIQSLGQIYLDWILGFENPTRIVIVAHSHGAIWAHSAVRALPDIPIDYLITLDGICTLWECEHSTVITDWLILNGDPFNFDITRPCDSLLVNGQPDPFHVSDVVFDNVAVNLEVQSDDILVFDARDNYRPDGTRGGIHTHVAVGEDHNDVRLASSSAMLWVTDMIRVLEQQP